MRIGQRSNVTCQRLRSVSGAFLPWLTEIKYLGVHIVESKEFKYFDGDQSRRSFYRAANAISGRVDRVVSEEVVLSERTTLRSLYAIGRPSVCLSVCLSVCCL